MSLLKVRLGRDWTLVRILVVVERDRGGGLVVEGGFRMMLEKEEDDGFRFQVWISD